MKVSRRTVIAAVGSTPFASSSVAAESDKCGYGVEYGACYGYPSDDEDPEPVITSLDAEDTSNSRNPHCDAEVEWSAEIDEGNLDLAYLRILDGDYVIESWHYYDIDSPSTSESESHRIRHGAGSTYLVALTVTSEHDTTDEEETRFISP